MTQKLNGADTAAGEGALGRLWDVKTLPSAEYVRDWDSIQGYKVVKAILRRYAVLTKRFAEGKVARREQDMSGLLLLIGPPGTGKSTLARGFANQFALAMGGQARIFRLRTDQVFSEWLGQSAKELGKAFDTLRFAAEQGPTVVLVDEIEAITFARKKVINSADPSDLVRSVDRLLQEIDALQRFPHTIVVGTSNFDEVIDDAFWSRADLVIRFSLPDQAARAAILQARRRGLQPLGLSLQREDLAEIAKAAEGLSGRALGKLFVQTFLRREVDFEEITVEDVLDTLKELQPKKEEIHGGR